ncbi:MAG: cobalamin adenosyltransferase [Osedax symbiont Rs2]|nr:MAG: cobalamin adenosyltransferase [Osedax symbiont Rs2]
MSDKTQRNRLDKIYTRGGDKGKTSLALGGRLSKADDHIKALGEVDELNCQLGVLIATLPAGQPLQPALLQIQNILFDIGAELAMNNDDYPPLAQQCIDSLEQQLDQLNSQLPPLHEFILPGGNISAAHCHLARAVCRRVERQLIQLATEKKSFPQASKYLNRLSDYLFVAARYLNLQAGGSEVFWQPSNK